MTLTYVFALMQLCQLAASLSCTCYNGVNKYELRATHTNVLRGYFVHDSCVINTNTQEIKNGDVYDIVQLSTLSENLLLESNISPTFTRNPCALSSINYQPLTTTTLDATTTVPKEMTTMFRKISVAYAVNIQRNGCNSVEIKNSLCWLLFCTFLFSQ